MKIKTLSGGQAEYSGRVKAKNDRCEKNRKVQVYDVSQGGFLIGEVDTDGKGKYELEEFVPVPGSQVQAIVPKKKKGKKKNKVKCGELRKTVTVPPSPFASGAP